MADHEWSENEILRSDNPVAAAIVLSGQRIGRALVALGIGDAASNMGAVEFHATHVGEALSRVSSSMSDIGPALKEIAYALENLKEEPDDDD